MSGPALFALAAGTAATLVALVLLRAAWHKAADLPGFEGTLADYRLLPERWVAPAARALLGAEALALALLLVPPTAALGALAAAALLLLYGGAIALNLLRGRTRIECGCGSPAQHLSPALVARNALLAAAAASVALAGPRALDAGGAVAAVAGGFILFVTLVAVEQILANDGHIRLSRTSRP